MKIIAYYLPQFHEIKENNEMWGKGFTEWTNVRKAKPLFKGHYQPVEPLNDFYYDLTNIETIAWQVSLAKEYGIYAFCFYHYWYNDHVLMEKPLKMFLDNKNLDLPFCISWANHNWTMGWANKDDTIIYKEDYSDKNEWKRHFKFLLPYFRDDRYIKEDNKPLLILYDAYGIKELNEMLDVWNEMAVQEGFNGIEFGYQSIQADLNKDFDDSRFKYDIEYQPQYTRVLKFQKSKTWLMNLIRKIDSKTLNLRNTRLKKLTYEHNVTKFDYDDIWKATINMKPFSTKSVPGAYVNMDTTPRRQERGTVLVNMNPQKFGMYLEQQIIHAKEEYHSDKLFLFAWNEWAEGAYLEPDKRWGSQILNEVKNALIRTNEFPGR